MLFASFSCIKCAWICIFHEISWKSRRHFAANSYAKLCTVLCTVLLSIFLFSNDLIKFPDTHALVTVYCMTNFNSIAYWFVPGLSMITYTVYLELDNALRSLEDHSVYLKHKRQVWTFDVYSEGIWTHYGFCWDCLRLFPLEGKVTANHHTLVLSDHFYPVMKHLYPVVCAGYRSTC